MTSEGLAACCETCGQELLSVKFGVWLIWLSLESGQVCPGGRPQAGGGPDGTGSEGQG